MSTSVSQFGPRMQLFPLAVRSFARVSYQQMAIMLDSFLFSTNLGIKQTSITPPTAKARSIKVMQQAGQFD